MKRCIGMSISGDKVTLVEGAVDGQAPIEILADQTWKLQGGDRAPAYRVMHDQIRDYLIERKIEYAVVKASALSRSGTKMGHLESAELRGVAICAAAAVCRVGVIAKAHLSRTFGDRKVDEYLSDDSFWTSEVAGASLRGGSREAALLLLASRE